MSSFLDLTPIVRIKVENPFLSRGYPPQGTVVAVIDTGYEGFVMIPTSVYEELELHRLQETKRILTLANGTTLSSRGAYASARIPHLDCSLDGFVETYDGLDEIIIGVQALSNFRMIADYCLKKLRFEKCASVS